MVEDVYEPLARYRDEYNEAFDKNAHDMFDGFVAESRVDPEANAKTIAEKKALENSRSVLKVKLVLATIYTYGLWIFAAYTLWRTYGNFSDWRDGVTSGWAWFRMVLWLATGGGCVALGIITGLPRIARYKDEIAHLDEEIKAKEEEAWRQMAPLNALFDWDAVAKLIEKTVPRIVLDRRFAAGRLDDLHTAYGWDDSFNSEKSVLGAQSGEINGNPFVVVETLNWRSGTQTYKGSLKIEWQERVRDSDGDGWHWTTKRQTLTASVEKFKPEYYNDKRLIYGCTAAPDLNFSRTPSMLSSMGDGKFATMCKSVSRKGLEHKARKVDGNFTMVANEEFEVLFHADDRDNEREFRFLFTPLAQEQMVRLLKDKSVAWGDDFTFEKKKLINVITSPHLDAMDINTDPSRYADFDFTVIKQNFLSFTKDFFKSFYFSLAPLLTIPAYQQIRSHNDIWKRSFRKQSCFWEHEAMANYQGEDVFKHPSSATRNILRTRVAQERGEKSVVEVTAYGYEKIPEVEYVPMRGNDGNMHDVPVEWIRYSPVEKTTPMTVVEREELALPDFRAAALNGTSEFGSLLRSGRWDAPDRYFRRAMLAFVGNPAT